MDKDTPPSIRIAIIDDDLASYISYEDLRSSDTDDDILKRIVDDTDPLYDELQQFYISNKIESDGNNSIVQAINNSNIRDSLPSHILDLVKAVEKRRESSSEPLRRIEEWISKYDNYSIAKYDSPENFLESNLSHNLYLVDYLLVNDDHNETKKFIKSILEKASVSDIPLFILMSSHEQKLIDDFSSLKSELEMTSSRFRILKKPTDDNAEHEWIHTIESLVREQELVTVLEKFTRQWINRFSESTSKTCSDLWCMDAYALSMFLTAANDDGISFYDYFSEVIMRKAMSEIEFSDSPHQITLELEKLLGAKADISAGSEIRDSRETVRQLINEFCWHKDWLSTHSEHKLKTTFSSSSFQTGTEEKTHPYLWIKHQLNFGTVLKKDTGELYIHLTQPCDLARISYDSRKSDYLFFLPGNTQPVNSDTKGQGKFSCSPSVSLDNKWFNIHWRLDNPRSYSVSELMNDIDSFTVVGRLRYELAQKVLTDYVSKISRVALIRIPDFFPATGFVQVSRKESADWTLISDAPVEAHLRKQDKDWIIELEPREAIKIATQCRETGLSTDDRVLVQAFSKGVIHRDDQLKVTIPNQTLESVYLSEEIYLDNPSVISIGLQRLVDKSKQGDQALQEGKQTKIEKRLQADPSKNQVRVVFIRI